MKKNTRKYNCPFCKVCSGCNHKEGCRVPKREGHEGLDQPNIHRFYGTMKMLNFS